MLKTKKLAKERAEKRVGALHQEAVNEIEGIEWRGGARAGTVEAEELEYARPQARSGQIVNTEWELEQTAGVVVARRQG